MDRTYNHLVDTGLFVLGELLSKDVYDINTKDIENSIGLIIQEINSMDKENFKKLSYMCFTNSLYTNQGKFGLSEKLKNEIRNFIEISKEGTEICSICNKTKVSKKLIPTRSIIPGLSSNTFFNYSNNLDIINVCPICCILSLFSILAINRTQNGAILYVSDNDDIMRLLVKRAMKNLKNEYKKVNYLDEIKQASKIICNSNLNGYMDIFLFNNYGQVESREYFKLLNSQIEILRKINNKNLFEDKFKNNNIFKFILDKNYYKLLELDYDLFSCFKEVYKGEEFMIDNLELDSDYIIKDFTKKIDSISKKDLVKIVSNIGSYSKFQEFVLREHKLYMEEKNEVLVNDEIYNIILDKFNWLNIKRKVIYELINLGN
ncbi:hypothetical protein [Clostridium baratii]|uniref:Uncharacterized protein n=1 Tax=Clostridium baratii TaxID=1561 RepID=A0A174V6P3_9CLOT|nr:hypothetical protein [Clostridium baratii]CUQ30424.1 Uncharacterised protein [Clostridium baratii]